MTPLFRLFLGVPYVVDPNMSLTFLDEDGVERPLLCRRVGGTILIHPDRLTLLGSAIRDCAGGPR